jgi:hypothetical protein
MKMKFETKVVILLAVLVLFACTSVVMQSVPYWPVTVSPNIKASCTMNGRGNGTCEFLNEGGAEGVLYITVLVKNRRTNDVLNSGPVYSGLVKARDIRERPFLVPGVDELCDADFARGESWTDVCSFEPVALDGNP